MRWPVSPGEMIRGVTLQALLGIELPIIQAPMAGVQDSALAVAVSNAGGLGSLPCALLSPASMRDELERIRAQTERPYNVNFFCHRTPTPGIERESAWQAAVAPYFREFKLELDAIPVQPTRQPFDDEAADVLSCQRRNCLRECAAGAQKCSQPPPPSTKRAGWRPTAPTRSSRRVSKRAAIAGCS